MGEARCKDLSDREAALAQSRTCIFCGSAPATTGDHCPPQALFVRRICPEGYIFPACKACNAGSKQADELVSFIARLNSGSKFKYAPAECDHTKRLGKSLEKKYPQMMQTMFGVSAEEKRALARRLIMSPEEGMTSKYLPIMRVPPEAQDSIRLLGAKMVKALHFKHSGKIVPSGAVITVEWQPNVAAVVDPMPVDLFKNMRLAEPLQRTKIDLSHQFAYTYQVEADGTVGSYLLKFCETFLIVGIVAFDPDYNRRDNA